MPSSPASSRAMVAVRQRQDSQKRRKGSAPADAKHTSPGVGRRNARPLGLARAAGAGCLALALLAGAGCTGVSKDFDAAIQERIRNATHFTQPITDLVEAEIGMGEGYHERLLAFGFEGGKLIRPVEDLLERHDADSVSVYNKYYRRRIVTYWNVRVFVFETDGKYSHTYAQLNYSSL